MSIVIVGKRVGLCLIVVTLLSCSKGDENDSKTLDMFKDHDSGLGTTEEAIVPAEKPLDKETANSHEEILGEEAVPEVIPQAKEEDVQKTNYKLNKVYSALATLTFAPINIYFSSEFEIIAVGRQDISKIDLNSHKETPLLTKAVYQSLFKKEMPLITSSSSQGGSDLILGFKNGEVIQHIGNDWKPLLGGPAYSNDSVNSIIEHEGKILIASKGIYIWEPDLNRFMSSQESKKLDIISILTSSPKLVIFVTSDALVSLSFPDKAITSFFTPLPSEQPILSLQEDGENFLVGTGKGIVRISKSGEILSRFASTFAVSKILKGEDNNFLVLTDKGPGILENDEIIADKSLAGDKVSSLSLGAADEIILGLSSGQVIKTSFSEFSSTFKNSENKEKVKEVFANACRAHEKLLGNSPYSHQISYIQIEREPFIFIDGKQVCPNGVGYMDKFGSAIVLVDGTFTLSDQGQIKTIKVPEDVISSKILNVHLAKDKTIYIGTEKGLYIGAPESFKKVEGSKELSEDFISDIIEDYRANIWVSSRIPTAVKDAETVGYNPLHVKIDENWAHFGKANGLNTFGISDLSSSNQDIIMGNARGYSILNSKSDLITYGRASGLKRSIIESITRDRKERIWTSFGFFLDGISWIDNDKVYTLDEKNGLFANRISRVGVDEEDRIWIIDSSGKTGVYDYQTLSGMAEVSVFNANRASREKFLP